MLELRRMALRIFRLNRVLGTAQGGFKIADYRIAAVEL